MEQVVQYGRFLLCIFVLLPCLLFAGDEEVLYGGHKPFLKKAGLFSKLIYPVGITCTVLLVIVKAPDIKRVLSGRYSSADTTSDSSDPSERIRPERKSPPSVAIQNTQPHVAGNSTLSLGNQINTLLKDKLLTEKRLPAQRDLLLRTPGGDANLHAVRQRQQQVQQQVRQVGQAGVGRQQQVSQRQQVVPLRQVNMGYLNTLDTPTLEAVYRSLDDGDNVKTALRQIILQRGQAIPQHRPATLPQRQPQFQQQAQNPWQHLQPQLLNPDDDPMNQGSTPRQINIQNQIRQALFHQGKAKAQALFDNHRDELNILQIMTMRDEIQDYVPPVKQKGAARAIGNLNYHVPGGNTCNICYHNKPSFRHDANCAFSICPECIFDWSKQGAKNCPQCNKK